MTKDEIIEKAKNGDAESQFILGNMYFFGDEVEMNHKLAFFWYEKSAMNGNVYAQYQVGHLCSMKDFGQDYRKSIYWLTQAINNGHEGAKNQILVSYLKLAEEYYQGKNYTEALKWHKKAALSGESFSQYRMGLFYEKGLGVNQDYSQAVEWYTKSAEQGNNEAQYNLANIFYMQNDYKNSYIWFYMSYLGYLHYDQTDAEKTKQRLDDISHYLSYNEIKEAESKAREKLDYIEQHTISYSTKHI